MGTVPNRTQIGDSPQVPQYWGLSPIEIQLGTVPNSPHRTRGR
jgi:hypothetical protein